MKKLHIIFAGLLLAFGLGFVVPAATASVDTQDAPKSIQAPADNQTTLTFFSCAATRPSGFTSGTVNHSHNIAAESVSGHIDAIDCEVYNNPGLDGCVWRTYYIYDNKANGADQGIVGPLNISCFS